MWVYIKSEPGLWTVGYSSVDGEWVTDSDHNDREEAAKRVAWLNGSGKNYLDILGLKIVIGVVIVLVILNLILIWK